MVTLQRSGDILGKQFLRVTQLIQDARLTLSHSPRSSTDQYEELERHADHLDELEVDGRLSELALEAVAD